MSNKDLHDKDIDNLLDGYGKQAKPDDNARKIALNLALAEFDRAQIGSKAGQNRASQKKSHNFPKKIFQGDGFFSRLIGRPTQEERTPLMQASQKAYLAIGGSLVALVAVIGYVGTQIQDMPAVASAVRPVPIPTATLRVALADKDDGAASGARGAAAQAVADAPPLEVARLDAPAASQAERVAVLQRPAEEQAMRQAGAEDATLLPGLSLEPQEQLQNETDNTLRSAVQPIDPTDPIQPLSEAERRAILAQRFAELDKLKEELASVQLGRLKVEQPEAAGREEQVKQNSDPAEPMVMALNKPAAQVPVPPAPSGGSADILISSRDHSNTAVGQWGGFADWASGPAPVDNVAKVTAPEFEIREGYLPGRTDDGAIMRVQRQLPQPASPQYEHDKPRVSDDRLMEIERVQRRAFVEPLPPELRGNVIAPAPTPEPVVEEASADRFKSFVENQMKAVNQQPVSTFSVDVDTSSYSFTRRVIEQSRRLPQQDAVRIEELVNYFDYNYPVPDSLETPFSTTVAITDSPWAAGRKLMHLGIKGYQLPESERPNSNLVFLIDVSGSMSSHDKLPLLQGSLNKLVDTLGADDRVAIVVYAGAAGTVLPPTRASNREVIKDAIRRLRSGGSTAGQQGIQKAYALAKANFDPEASNRVILATDGDFNVGISDTEQLKSYIEKERESGVFLSILGFGQGNLNDELMQALAQNGNGTAAYIDSDKEADKVLVREAGSTLFTIAKDVKLQLEFNPAKVAEYRLIGYETRALRKEDFDNDRIDAGDIGAGHTVTAIYEFTPVGGPLAMAPSRYTPVVETVAEISPAMADEYAFLKIRYKRPDEDVSNLITRPVTEADVIDSLPPVDCGPEENCVQSANDDVRFATAVAGFGQLLRHGRYTARFGYDQVIEMAEGAIGADPYGDRRGFVEMVRKARDIAMPYRRYRD